MSIKYRHFIIEVKKDGEIYCSISGDNIPARMRFSLGTNGDIIVRDARVDDVQAIKVSMPEKLSKDMSGLGRW